MPSIPPNCAPTPRRTVGYVLRKGRAAPRGAGILARVGSALSPGSRYGVTRRPSVITDVLTCSVGPLPDFA